MLESFIHERVKLKKPLQYILGSVPFCNLNIIIKPPILIPRPETEEWVTWLINSLEPIKNQPLDILDLCTGSGCISLALAKALPQATIIGIDINKAAIELAQENMYHNKIDNCVFLQSDLYQAIPPNQQFDLIVSNPPYLSEVEWHNLDYSVKNWEDKQALRADNAGMALYEKIITQAPTYLKKSSILTPLKLPQIILELGTQHRYIQKTLEVRNFINIILHSDLQGKIRWISACV